MKSIKGIIIRSNIHVCDDTCHYLHNLPPFTTRIKLIYTIQSEKIAKCIVIVKSEEFEVKRFFFWTDSTICLHICILQKINKLNKEHKILLHCAFPLNSAFLDKICPIPPEGRIRDLGAPTLKENLVPKWRVEARGVPSFSSYHSLKPHNFLQQLCL